MKSHQVTRGIERAPHRSLFKAMGFTTEELQRPLIGVANSANTFIPGHAHLHPLVDAVKAGILSAGGTPLEFGVIGICDGIAMNHVGMKYSLASRELIADSVEVMARAHALDALVLVASCDKIVPGMMMAAARLDIPAILLSGGPMLAGTRICGPTRHPIDLITVFEAIGAVRSGRMSEAEMEQIENAACPTCGSCAGMFTANSMNCLSEAIGLALPGNGTVPAVMAERMRLAKRTGRAILELLQRGITPRSILTPKAFENALRVDMALGCSTNTVLHLTALANEAGVPIDLDAINAVSRTTPHLCFLSPAGPHHLQDLNDAGGITAVMHELSRKGLIHLDCMTASGQTVGERIADSPIRDSSVIRSVDDPYHEEGGLAILFGNLAPEGCVVKQSAVLPEMMRHEGPARVFDSETEACQAILSGKIRPGDVVVIRYEGPMGGPGMQEMLSPTSAIVGMGLDSRVALITDGRFSGGSKGAAIGHISPEAMQGGPIALVREGDRIRIDIPAKTLSLLVSEQELASRKAAWQPPEPRIRTGYLARYARQVSSAARGAVVM
ncbi:MAG: dihydroxy-acid dehydratase [Thermodesulfobacteriota bacterium]